VLQRTFVLETDLVDELGLDDEPLVDGDGKRLRVGLGIVAGELSRRSSTGLSRRLVRECPRG
jgi:hypothetical protein